VSGNRRHYNNFIVKRFFSVLSLDLESVKIFAAFGTHSDLFKEKSFQLHFLKNNRWSILINSMVWSQLGEGVGDAKFLLKGLALHPICLKTSVVLKVSSSI